MSLWNNTDANTSAPIYSPMQVDLAPTQENVDTLYDNVTQDAIITGKAVGVFGIDATEKTGSYGNVSSLTITSAGTGFTARPTVTVTGANNVQAIAIANGTVVGVTITAAGTGYANDQILTANTGAGTYANVRVTNVDGSGNVLAVTIAVPGDYTTLPTLTNNKFESNTSVAGSGFTANLAIGVGSTRVTTKGESYGPDAAVTVGGAGGTGATVAVVYDNSTQEGQLAAHAGWNLRTEGSGGRSGRVSYETLVAMGSLTSDGTDDNPLAP